ncbi:hypothetical protein BpHYR1_048030 [Brachionus plicatilis]|uniref:Uncharacterized protein n=1 Tax=Brachionus plicatilis TaxID=10195 RepID=A0A3M7T9K2_BRAPC|nr:hypothetical protein BpHYR1_048030 [Brachionus plicatilis]
MFVRHLVPQTPKKDLQNVISQQHLCFFLPISIEYSKDLKKKVKKLTFISTLKKVNQIKIQNKELDEEDCPSLRFNKKRSSIALILSYLLVDY